MTCKLKLWNLAEVSSLYIKILHFFILLQRNSVMALSMFFLILLHLLLEVESKCPKSFDCGHHRALEFPLSNDPNCGLFVIKDCGSPSPTIDIRAGEHRYSFIMNHLSANQLTLFDYRLEENDLIGEICLSFDNLPLPQSPSFSFTLITPNLTLFKCSNQHLDDDTDDPFDGYKTEKCGSDWISTPSTVYYKYPNKKISSVPSSCSVSQLPVNSDSSSDDLFKLKSPEFTVEWRVSEACLKCHREGGKCIDKGSELHCEKGGGNKLKLILGISGGVLSFFLCLVIIFMVLRRRKSKGGYFLSRNISSSPSSKSDIEGGSFYFGIPIFSYEELEKATNKFDQTKELGDGGFGTVYYGRLEDGREVAIKRLYEHNYRRVEQFLNEIKILTCLRHPNLVSLYGCTSRRSRELLLVYEYISNGTVADHLHGERAKEAPLSWPVRMSIAIETATALAYLHNSDIIHRDVKTNNILLDANFCVKVADFGLSRLFPIDCTHISTAPQGTPGYVDPEYHQCYQLTDRSDVYSFGVVLIELISSMPAVDISRHRHEINLANLAMNRIQRCAFDELIDPSLGYDTDPEVTRMTTSVAELAFRCLQLEKDLRPSMDEVVCFLKEIKYGEDCDFEQMKGAAAPGKIPPSPETDDAVLLKSKAFQSSPTAVTDAWVSSDSTTASSVG